MTASQPFTASAASIDGASYRQMFDGNPQAMLLFDGQTLGFVDVNQAATALYGYSRDEFLRMDVNEIRAPLEVPAALEPIDHEPATLSRVSTHRRKDGRLIDVEMDAQTLVVAGREMRLAVVRNVAEGRRLDEQLRQSQKIETVGQLAGGIAHEFNNLLTAIIGHTELLSEYFAPGDPRAAEVAGIKHAADLAATLTRQLLAFSRKQTLQPTVLDLNDVVDQTRRTLGRLLGEHIELVTEPEAGLRSVKADAGQVEQILLNLAINGRDAMPEGGRLAVRTRNTYVGRAEARRLGLKAGDYVALSVSDTGAWIETGVRAHLFEPFFSTKELGRGTGLGLATVYGIVKQSGGHITVDSDAGVGTTFTIVLPATPESPARSGGARHHAAATDRGTETVMLVEDDAAVRTLISAVLGARGYTLLAAAGGRQALEAASAHEGPIDLLITDVVMSGMGGPEVADAIRARYAGVKVLYISGYTHDVMPRGVVEADAAFLHKPFTPESLRRKVRAVLESTPAPARP